MVACGRAERRVRRCRHRVRRGGSHSARLALPSRISRIGRPGRRHGARLQLPQGVLPRQVRGGDRRATGTSCSPTTTGTSVTATESRGRSSIRGCRCVTTVMRSPSRRRSTASIGDRVGVWGTSYAGGHVLVVAAIDRRVGCVVAQVPTISGWESTLRRIAPPALADQRRAFDADRLERFRGGPPADGADGRRPGRGRGGLPRERGRVGVLHRAERAAGGSSGDSTSGATRSRCDRSSCTPNTSPGRSSSGSRRRRC